MTLRLTAALTADVRGLLAGEVAAGERAARGAVTDTGRWTQEQLRGQVRSGFGARSARLANTWRLAVYPTSVPTLRPAALVSSRAPAIIDAFDRGAVIRPRGGGRYLAVPLEANRRGGLRTSRPRVTPAQMAASRAAFLLPLPGSRNRLWCLRVTQAQRRSRAGRVSDMAVAGNLVQVGARGTTLRGTYLSRGRLTQRLLAQGFVPMFLLLPKVQLTKRLDVKGAAERGLRRLPGRFVAAWERESGRAAP
jgi:hypothetical protein